MALKDDVSSAPASTSCPVSPARTAWAVRSGGPPIRVSDACVTENLEYRVVCNTAARDNMVVAAGQRLEKMGCGFYDDDSSSDGGEGLSGSISEVPVGTNKQNHDMAGGVHAGKADLDVDASDPSEAHPEEQRTQVSIVASGPMVDEGLVGRSL